MRVTSLQLQDFRCFKQTVPIELGALNVLVGSNNSGKSTILRSLHLLQQGGPYGINDIRAGAQASRIEVGLEGVNDIAFWGQKQTETGQLTIDLTMQNRQNFHLSLSIKSQNSTAGLSQLPMIEPDHFIVPYLSRRKTGGYIEDVRSPYAMQVTTDMSMLAAKLSRIANPGFPAFPQYQRTCEQILGFLVTAIPSANGQRPGIYLPDMSVVPIEQMGEGVPNIVALLAELAIAKGKLFLIEEPENDLHPNALKALLDLILESSKLNQFIISTHSNIVVRHLASQEDSRLYRVRLENKDLPHTSSIELVDVTPEARLDVLRDLGYTLSDFDLWDGWLFLEESSAERIIRDHLIPWFSPKLSCLRTLAVGGVSEIEPSFCDFHRMVRFTHLESVYRETTWVKIDGDQPGREVVDRLRKTYAGWDADRFSTFGRAQFEHYYPVQFAESVAVALAVQDRKRQRAAKKALLDDVLAWIKSDEMAAKAAFSQSAREVIDYLQAIEQEFDNRGRRAD